MACSGRFRDFESAWKYTLSSTFAVTLIVPSEVFLRLSPYGPVSASAFSKVGVNGRLGALSSKPLSVAVSAARADGADANAKARAQPRTANADTIEARRKGEGVDMVMGMFCSRSL